MEKTNFERFELQPFLIEAIKQLGFYNPTEIQERLIPSVLKGDSVIGQSQTGTGKTHAYLLPLLEKVNPAKQEVQVVIAAPTRELASQIYKEVLKITKYCEEGKEITAKCFIGGTDKQRTIEKLKKQPQIVVGTPSRLFDLVNEKALFVHTTAAIVVDEADLMLDMGFLEDVDRLASSMPEKLQMLVFSATIPEKLKPFLKKYMDNPKYSHVSPNQVAAAKLEHVLVPLRHRNKFKLLHDMLLSYNPYLAIVFTNTKKMADEVADDLMAKGLRVGRIHGDLTPRDRKKMMKQISNLEFQYVVATDLAARGIDIEGISHVINFELPSDLDFYIHRVGRTARAGYSGIAATMYDVEDEDAVIRLEKMGIEFVNKDLKNGEWISIDDRNRRKKRQKKTDDVDKEASRLIQKPKKVKPGYKKKRAREIQKFVQKKKEASAGIIDKTEVVTTC